MLKKIPKILLAAGCGWAFALQAAPHAAGALPVARVSMTVGDAQRIGASGQATPLSLGTELAEQDRIITGKDAMVILIFSDQARVALRPDSELLIRRYKVDPKGVDTQLQLDLLRGTFRQISGHGAQKQPERYRLNTPIAAIGVRGTDFLAKAGQGGIEAYVHEGAIVVAPLASTGTSGELASVNLAAGFGVQYTRTGATQELARQNVAPSDLERVFGIRIASSVAATPDSARSYSTARVDRFDRTVVASLAASRDRDTTGVPVQASASVTGGVVQPSVMMVPTSPEVLPTSTFVAPPSAIEPPLVPPTAELPPAVNLPVAPPVVVVPPPVVTPPVVVMPPVVTPPVTVQLPTQLAWGKFNNPQLLPFTLPRAYTEVQAGAHTTVGELGQYALWRDGVNGSLDKSLRGQAQFVLAAGEAFYQQAGKAVALTLADPKLSIDFDRMGFSTQLGLSGAGAPSQQLNVSGRMNDEGVFLGTAAGQRVAGALSRNGAEAGYLFKIDNSVGKYQGITLWNAK